MKTLLLTLLLFILSSTTIAQHSISLGTGLRRQNKTESSYTHFNYSYSLNFNSKHSLSFGLEIGYYNRKKTFQNPEYNAIYKLHLLTGSIPIIFNTKFKKFKIGVGIVGDFNWMENKNIKYKDISTDVIIEEFNKYYYGTHDEDSQQYLQMNLGLSYLFNSKFEASINSNIGIKRSFFTLSLNYNFGRPILSSNIKFKKKVKFWLGVKGGLLTEQLFSKHIYNNYFAFDFKTEFPIFKNFSISPIVKVGYYKIEYSSKNITDYFNNSYVRHEYSNKAVTGNLIVQASYRIKSIRLSAGVNFDFNFAQNYNRSYVHVWYGEVYWHDEKGTKGSKLFSGLGLDNSPIHYNASVAYLFFKRVELEAACSYGDNKRSYTLGLNFLMNSLSKKD